MFTVIHNIAMQFILLVSFVYASVYLFSGSEIVFTDTRLLK